MGELSFEVTRTRLIRSSQIAQDYFHAAKPDRAEEVLSMKFVADNQPAEPVQPGEQPLHHPAAQVVAFNRSFLWTAGTQRLQTANRLTQFSLLLKWLIHRLGYSMTSLPLAPE